MKFSPLLILVFCVFTLLLISHSVFSFLEIQNLKSSKTSLESNLSQTQNRLNAEIQKSSSLEDNLTASNLQIRNLTSLLNQTNSSLQFTLILLNQTRSNLQNTQTDLVMLRNNLSQIKTELRSIQSEINSSIDWFKENSYLPSSLLSFERRSSDDCLDSGYLNLACIAFKMDRELNFKYKTENPDHLFSLTQMVQREGGDCEDFSLFLKAYLNTLKTHSDYVLGGWKNQDGSRYEVYRSGSTIYYFNGVGVEFGRISSFYPVVICYLTSIENGVYQGHCIVALSKSEIKETSDLKNLKNAILFEPQNGMYMGKIGSDLYLCEEGNYNCDKYLNTISFVITDNDLYHFENGKWSNFHDVLNSSVSLEMDFPS